MAPNNNMNIQLVTEKYFDDLRRNSQHHMIEATGAEREDIKGDFNSWYAGFRAAGYLMDQHVELPDPIMVEEKVLREYHDSARKAA